MNIIKCMRLHPSGLLVTTDVSSLYTNIPYTEGTAAITMMMEEVGSDLLLEMFITNSS